jgi:hypothetical protein
MPAGEMRVFVFDIEIASLESLYYWTAFTEDADKRWSIDQDLHLRQVKPEYKRRPQPAPSPGPAARKEMLLAPLTAWRPGTRRRSRPEDPAD